MIVETAFFEYTNETLVKVVPETANEKVLLETLKCQMLSSFGVNSLHSALMMYFKQKPPKPRRKKARRRK